MTLNIPGSPENLVSPTLQKQYLYVSFFGSPRRPRVRTRLEHRNESRPQPRQPRRAGGRFGGQHHHHRRVRRQLSSRADAALEADSVQRLAVRTRARKRRPQTVRERRERAGVLRYLGGGVSERHRAARANRNAALPEFRKLAARRQPRRRTLASRNDLDRWPAEAFLSRPSFRTATSALDARAGLT